MMFSWTHLNDFNLLEDRPFTILHLSPEDSARDDWFHTGKAEDQMTPVPHAQNRNLLPKLFVIGT